MELLAGKYELLRKLARGGMAEVYLARTVGPMGFEKILVVKRILPHLTDEGSFVGMFLSEARLAAQLNHPNVVQIFDFGESGGTYFLVMEFIDGLNLRTLRKNAANKSERVDLRLAAKVISLAAEGLQYAHGFIDPKTNKHLLLVHRDISPDNILVGKNGGVKVVDFGIAKAADQTSSTKTGTIKGKLAYMSPEQVANETLDGRADVYALGIVLYELVTGVKPFASENDAVIIGAILQGRYAPAAMHREHIPTELQQIFDKCFARREQRYASARELQIDLERFIENSGSSLNSHDLASMVVKFDTPVDGPAIQETPAVPQNATASLLTPSAQSLPFDEEILFVTGTQVESKELVSPEPVILLNHPKRFEPLQHRSANFGAQNLALPVRPVKPEAEPATRAPKRASTPRSLATALGFSLVIAALVAGALVMKQKWQSDVTTEDKNLVASSTTGEPPARSAEAVVDNIIVALPIIDAGLLPFEPDVPVEQPQPEEQKMPAPNPIRVTQRVLRSHLKKPTPTPSPVLPPVLVPASVAPVDFRIRPFGSVFVDGVHVGESPFAPLNLSVGIHVIRVVNSELKLEVTKKLEVVPGENSFRHNFEP